MLCSHFERASSLIFQKLRGDGNPGFLFGIREVYRNTRTETDTTNEISKSSIGSMRANSLRWSQLQPGSAKIAPPVASIKIASHNFRYDGVG
jgi:hypothetical protein